MLATNFVKVLYIGGFFFFRIFNYTISFSTLKICIDLDSGKKCMPVSYIYL